jgi:hypothetical protein
VLYSLIKQLYVSQLVVVTDGTFDFLGSSSTDLMKWGAARVGLRLRG